MTPTTPTLDVFRADFDRYMTRLRQGLAERGSPVPCQAGCAGCCRGEVLVFEGERERVLAALPPEAYLRLAAQGPDVNPRQATCPALDPLTRLCSIYAERPLVCRGYVVINHPDLCHPERSGDATVSIVQQPVQVLREAAAGMSTAYLRDLMLARTRTSP